MLYESVAQLIGNTPLVALNAFAREAGISARILGKLESYNPAGSAKDRPALFMIAGLAANGNLQKGGTLIEATSGNTGIALAAVASSMGYQAIFTMPDSMSRERIQLFRAYGARVELTPGTLGMAGAIERAKALHREIAGSVMIGQFENADNARAHYETTGPELLRDTNGDLDCLIATVGSGGTITGAGAYLKEHIPGLRVIAVEPAASPLLSGGKAGPHGIMGIGANFIPPVLDQSVYDEVITVTEEESRHASSLMAHREGLLVGISSGAALAAAVKLAQRKAFSTAKIACILPDGGERYLSTGLFEGE